MSGQTVTRATAPNTSTEIVRQYRDDFAMVLPRHVNADQWVRLTTGMLRRNDKLASVARSNPASLLAALLDCARLGLEPGDTYHLVPFGSEIVGIPDYTGLIELIYRAGMVRSVKCEIVARADLAPDPTDDHPVLGHGRPRFEWHPSEMDRPHHRPDWFGDRSDMVGVYAYAVMLDGSTSQVIMRNKSEIEKVQAVSRTGRDPGGMWMQWPDRAWRKTVLRELSKFVPTSAEFRGDNAVALDQVTSSRIPAGPLVSDDVIDGDVIAEPPDQLGAAREQLGEQE